VKKKAFMDLKIVDKIIEELSVRKFEGTLSLGENGDALINPRFKEIVERIHENLNCNVILFTNMMQIDRELSKFLLDKGLNLLHLNIDGNCKETYEYSKKGCKYDVVTRNLHDFIKLRDETGKNCALAIKVLPPKRYMKYIEGKDVDIPYDAKETVEYWRPFLSKDDSISEHITFSRWALQSEIPRGLPCPNTRQLFECCYINTEGEAYFCCVDYLTEMTYGNVMETSIYEAWNGKKRKETLKAIIGKDFQRTGKPCSICPEKNDYIRSYLHYLTYKG
jgi:MoaA/NifB/PqqE/SkfB family radical SAM enzyme